MRLKKPGQGSEQVHEAANFNYQIVTMLACGTQSSRLPQNPAEAAMMRLRSGNVTFTESCILSLKDFNAL